MNISLQQLGIKGTEEWFFGNMTRDRANEILLLESVGVYLIRASSSQPGGFALSVRDNEKTNHYKIEATKRLAHDGYKFKIGNLDFPSIPQLIEYYKKSKLADSTLTVPAAKPMYRAKFDFKVNPNNPDSAEDLPLRRNEVVFYLSNVLDADGMEIPGWWLVQKRSTGEVGHVPASYLALTTAAESDENKFRALRQQISFPLEVVAMRERNPNIFDASQLRLEVGDIVEVQRASDQQPEFWYGTVRRTQRQGLFPFNYVRPASLLAEDDLRQQHQQLSSTPSLSGSPQPQPPPLPPLPARVGSRSFSSRSRTGSQFSTAGLSTSGDQIERL